MPQAKTPPNLMIQLPSGKSPDSLAEQGEMHKFTSGDAVLESQEEILLPQLPHTLVKITDPLLHPPVPTRYRKATSPLPEKSQLSGDDPGLLRP